MEIRLEKFSKSFGPVNVIEDMDLTIGDCEMIALLGPSGCGKTTTLYAVCGIHRVTSGRIWFGDKDVTLLPPQKKNVGVVFQSFALYPHLSAYENIAFPLRIRKDSAADVERMVKEIAGVLHMEALLDRRPGQLSGGQQQRVALARALVRRPDVLLMDEPLANLDAGLRLEMRSEIRRIQQDSGCTSILVTHDQVEAMSMCDRIALMNEGKIQQIGSPDDMYHRPENKFTAGFIGNPPISFTDGTIEDGRFVTQGLGFDLPERIKRASVTVGQKLTLGVRPEYLQPDFTTPVEGEITFIESQGREILYDLTLAGGQVFRSIQSGDQVCQSAIEFVGESMPMPFSSSMTRETGFKVLGVGPADTGYPETNPRAVPRSRERPEPICLNVLASHTVARIGRGNNGPFTFRREDTHLFDAHSDRRISWNRACLA